MIQDPSLLSLAAVVVLALVHLFASRLRFIDAIPRSRLLSFGGGISVAYVFVRILPVLDQGQETVERELGPSAGSLQYQNYLVALAGLTVFLGLERLVQRSRDRQRATRGEDRTSPAVFRLHIASFAVVNALFGYLLAERGVEGAQRLLLFATALGLYFLVNDYGLRQQHKDAYRYMGRWVLAAALLLGWGLRQLVAVPALVLAIVLAFLGGGVTFNILKEELPAERDSRFWAFALGAAAYAALLALV